MTQEQKRIKIAESCGWLDISLGLGTEFRTADGVLIKGPFNDLNACHDMEKSLCSIDHWIRFEKYLAELGTKFIWHATAAQRAEAFGLTLNLWE